MPGDPRRAGRRPVGQGVRAGHDGHGQRPGQAAGGGGQCLQLLFKEIADITDAEFDRIVDINFKSVFYTLREAATKLSDQGRVVTISSTVTNLMLPKYGAYAATKAAVEQLTKIFAKEMGQRGITANIVSPGPVDTELFRTGKTPEDIERMKTMAALGRLGEVDDIAQVVLFLVSDAARWISGQNIRANGGII